MPDDDVLNQRLAARLRQLRAAAGLSLEALAQRSGVSRSMLSVIERGESSPTAVLLERVATALGVMLADLFQPPPAEAAAGRPPSPLSRAADQAAWTDPASGYQRRNLSPPGFDQPLRLVAVRFPPGATVAYETAERHPPVHQQVWLQAGRLRIALGDAPPQDLAPGDCLAMRLDRPISFHNPGDEPAQYLVAIATEPETPR